MRELSVDVNDQGSLEEEDLVEELETLRAFVNIIDKHEIKIPEQTQLGSGTFGVVRKGTYCRDGKSIEVAVKVIYSHEEKLAFKNEVTQLSKVNHENIVTIYGAHLGDPCYLVMEYAAGGSLYNVLHCKPYINCIQYSLGHAMSWLLQCMRGLDYLHNMVPKPLVHRDLKPPNLLLVDDMMTLKICDFGTACDLHTNMTNCKGSAAWMAPEVFAGSNYSEKCDIFSWGIIMWEILARAKPYERCQNAFQIMWAIKANQRPAEIMGIPKVFTDLMHSCWAEHPNERPNSTQVLEKCKVLYEYCKDQVVPLRCIIPIRSGSSTSTMSVATSDNSSRLDNDSSVPATARTPVATQRRPTNLLGEGGYMVNNALSDPNTPSTSRQGTPDSDISARTHRRQGSAGSATGASGGVSFPRMPPRKSSWPTTPAEPVPPNIPVADLGLQSHLLIEPRLQPLPPLTESRESVQIFEKHKRECQWFFKRQKEIAYLMDKIRTLDQELEKPVIEKVDIMDKYDRLFKDQKALMQMKDSLRTQLGSLTTRSRTDSDEGWVMVD